MIRLSSIIRTMTCADCGEGRLRLLRTEFGDDDIVVLLACRACKSSDVVKFSYDFESEGTSSLRSPPKAEPPSTKVGGGPP